MSEGPAVIIRPGPFNILVGVLFLLMGMSWVILGSDDLGFRIFGFVYLVLGLYGLGAHFVSSISVTSDQVTLRGGFRRRVYHADDVLRLPSSSLFRRLDRRMFWVPFNVSTSLLIAAIEQARGGPMADDSNESFWNGRLKELQLAPEGVSV